MFKAKQIKQLEVYSDREIIEKVLGGEKALYEVIIRRYNPYLYKTGRSYGYNHQDTEDLMQETFINAFTSLKSFENRSSFKTWITRIMLNNCFQKRKRFSFSNEIPTEFKQNESYKQMFTKKETDADQNVFRKELNRIIENALAEIPLRYRLVFSLRELNGFSTRQTAEALSISEANVKTRFSRAKKMLRQHIEKMYSPEDIYEFNLIYCDQIVERVMSVVNPRSEM